MPAPPVLPMSFDATNARADDAAPLPVAEQREGKASHRRKPCRWAQRQLHVDSSLPLHARYRTLPAYSATVITADRGDFRQPHTVLPGASLLVQDRGFELHALSHRPAGCSYIADRGRGRHSRAESDRWPNGPASASRRLPADCFAQIARYMSGRCGQRPAKIEPRRPGRLPLYTRGQSNHHPRGLPWAIDGYRGLAAWPWSLSI